MFDLNTKFGRVVKKHLKNEYFVWLTTVDAKGTPQPRPVWFIWDNDSCLIFSQPTAYKIKHLKNNTKVSLHFNTQDEEGKNTSSSLLERLHLTLLLRPRIKFPPI